jgi:hypothetical protein
MLVKYTAALAPIHVELRIADLKIWVPLLIHQVEIRLGKALHNKLTYS